MSDPSVWHRRNQPAFRTHRSVQRVQIAVARANGFTLRRAAQIVVFKIYEEAGGGGGIFSNDVMLSSG